MHADRMEITLADMTRLATDASAQTRARIASKIAANLSTGAFSSRESILALDILRVLARDSEVHVRAAISCQIRDCLTVPHSLVRGLAQDVTEVALPLLADSYILTEEDLIHIVRGTDELPKWLAIAGRESVSMELCEALLATRHTEVMALVIANRGTALAEHQIMAQWEHIIAAPVLRQALAGRGGLPVRIAEKLYAEVPEEMKAALAGMYRLPVGLAEGDTRLREWALQELARIGAGQEGEPPHVAELVEKLHAHERLSVSLVIRSLCMGDLEFFEAALARLAGIPRAIGRILLLDRGPLGFRSLYSRAQLPEAYFPALRAVMEATMEETAYGRLLRQDLPRRVRARIQAAGFDRTVEHMDYLLTLIDQQGGMRAASETLY